MKRLTLLLCLSLTLLTCRKDDTQYTITGHFYNRLTGEGIDSVLLRLYSYTDGNFLSYGKMTELQNSQTDSEGKFSFQYENLNRSEDGITVQYYSTSKRFPNVGDYIKVPFKQNTHITKAFGGIVNLYVEPRSAWVGHPDTIHIILFSDWKGEQKFSVVPDSNKRTLIATTSCWEYCTVEFFGYYPENWRGERERRDYPRKNLVISESNMDLILP